MKQLTDEVFAQVRGALEQADIYLEEGSQSHSINRLAIAALDAAQPVQVNAMLVEALKDALHSLQVPRVSCQHGVVSKCKCRKCSVGRGDAALTAARQAQPEPISVYRLAKKEDGVWLPASEWLTGYPDPSWDGLVKAHPELWSVQRRVTGKQIADGFAKAMGQQAQPERAPLSLQEIADAWGLKPESIPASDIEAVREIEAAHGIKQGGQHD